MASDYKGWTVLFHKILMWTSFSFVRDCTINFNGLRNLEQFCKTYLQLQMIRQITEHCNVIIYLFILNTVTATSWGRKSWIALNYAYKLLITRNYLHHLPRVNPFYFGTLKTLWNYIILKFLQLTEISRSVLMKMYFHLLTHKSTFTFH